MQKEKSRPGLTIPKRLGFAISRIYQRADSKPAAEPHSTKIRHCGHLRAATRHVVERDGGIKFICRECYQRERASEYREIVRGQVAKLFGGRGPQGINPGAALPGRGAI